MWSTIGLFWLSNGTVLGQFIQKFSWCWKLGFAFCSFVAWVKLSLAWIQYQFGWLGINCRCFRVRSKSWFSLIRLPMSTWSGRCKWYLRLDWRTVRMAVVIGLFAILLFFTVRFISRFLFVRLLMFWFVCSGCLWLWDVGLVPKAWCTQQGLPWFRLNEFLLTFYDKKISKQYFIRWQRGPIL